MESPRSIGWWVVSSSTSGATTDRTCPTPGYDALNATTGAWPGCPAATPVCNFPLGPNPVGLVDTPFYSDLGYRLNQYAGFGEATWHVTDQWGLTGGLRYYKYKETRIQSFNGVFAGNGPIGVQGSVDSDGVSPAAF